eukprot:CAMPEP_0179423290 /NCGR_PEP_ID=MMETSP0799-20121207/10925_1 /TAXON_ID=46947 /ORGANISM="Geminigera cryophila, Strain CCMP2564" /LENGTH=207 /DNA_ID=CAMNT_0021197563 /DNA_START=690 /DNA_END=1314 /DNA_ORIENTATION=+
MPTRRSVLEAAQQAALLETVLLAHMYQAPNTAAVQQGPTAMATAADDKPGQEHFDDYYEEVFEELEKFGKIDELNVCANLGDHMIGNVYVKYEEEEQAEKALNALNGRFYAGRLIMAEYSPVTDFRESRCRQYEESSCKYGGHCNFMHIKRPSRDVCKRLGIRTTYEAARGGGGGPGGGGGGGEARHTFTNALRKFSCGHMFVLSDL